MVMGAAMKLTSTRRVLPSLDQTSATYSACGAYTSAGIGVSYVDSLAPPAGASAATGQCSPCHEPASKRSCAHDMAVFCRAYYSTVSAGAAYPYLLELVSGSCHVNVE